MLKKDTLLELELFIKENLEVTVLELQERISSQMDADSQYHNIDDFLAKRRTASFSDVLFNFIDNKGKTDVEVYKKAALDRRHFSKIRSNPKYKISKHKAIALALALELSKKETDELLSSAGYSLSYSDTFDLVILYCLENRIYDLDNVNHALDYFHEKTLF
jgi:predicted CopG family antitoxin